MCRPIACGRLQRIHLHAARPAGVNEPTAEGVAGTLEILRIVESLSADDLCICLISGGGSALLPAPPPEISLADKLAVTRHLSAAGADITQLNTVRKQLSRIKGGGLLRACRAGRLISLIISDVLGDPLGPDRVGPDGRRPFDAGRGACDSRAIRSGGKRRFRPRFTNIFAEKSQIRRTAGDQFVCSRENHILANNATAVDAAGIEAVRLGYAHAMTAATRPEGEVEPIGRHLADMAIAMRSTPGPDCLISGGEGVVRLVDSNRRGLGGRNQQLALRRR